MNMVSGKKPLIIFLLLFALGSTILWAGVRSYANNKVQVHKTEKTLNKRIEAPEGYTRVALDSGSFGFFLRNIALLSDTARVKYYNGELKYTQHLHAAILDVSVGKKDLQQCADAIIRLRAEYLWAKKDYRSIAFNFTNGFRAEYSRWAEGERIRVKGNNVSWYNSGSRDYSYSNFLSYLETVFMYAGTLSLDKELKAKDVDKISPGDVFIKGGSPGHAIIVMDVAENEKGEKVFMLAQSYMPAQSIHVLKNLSDSRSSPWYAKGKNPSLFTPEWNFSWDQLKTW